MIPVDFTFLLVKSSFLIEELEYLLGMTMKTNFKSEVFNIMEYHLEGCEVCQET